MFYLYFEFLIPSNFQAVDRKEREFYPQLISTNEKMCMKDIACSTNLQMQHLMVISAKHSSNGNYFLKVKVTYENETTESSITTLKYNVESNGSVLFLSLICVIDIII